MKAQEMRNLSRQFLNMAIVDLAGYSRYLEHSGDWHAVIERIHELDNRLIDRDYRPYKRNTEHAELFREFYILPLLKMLRTLTDTES